MKRTLLLLVCLCTMASMWAIDLPGTYINYFYRQGVYRYTTATVTLDGTEVKITNLFNYGTTVMGTYDEAKLEIRIPAGQIVYTSSKGDYGLYSYTLDENQKRVVDKTTDILFTINESSDHLACSSEQRMTAYNVETETGYNYNYVSLNNGINGTMRCEVLDYQNQTEVKRTEVYPVRIELAKEGRYAVRNFDQKARVYFNVNRDCSVSTTFGDFPVDYASTYDRYFYPCAFEWKTNRYNSADDRSIYGKVSGNVMTLTSIWNYILDNTDNMDMEESKRKIISYSSDMHRNTTITLEKGNFLLPHVAHEVSAAGEDLLTTEENFKAAYQEGWMWSGDKVDDNKVNPINNKKATIEPFTDTTIDKTIYPGIGIKDQGNGYKNIYMRLKGLSALKYYVINTGGGERTAVATATPANETMEPVTVQTTCGDNATGMGTIANLNPEETYDIEFYTTAKEDMELYAVQLLTSTTGIGEVKSSLSLQSAMLYDLQGRRLTAKPQNGLYIQNGRKVVVK